MTDLARLIDANANRAREGLRVLEDVARFVLGDAQLCTAIRELRHQLLAAMASLAGPGPDRLMLLAWRDVEHDPGAESGTSGTPAHADTGALVAAAAARASEALRVLEECARTLPGPGGRAAADVPAGASPASAAEAFARVRYRLYTIERRVGLAVGTQRARPWRLCVVITEAACRHPWEDVADAAARAGADVLQLREKDLPDREHLARARRLVQIAHARHVPAIINDRPDIALLAGADGVHVGEEDIPVEAVRRLAGAKLIVGATARGRDSALAAVHAGADYLGVGPVFPSTTKPLLPPPGLDRLRQCLQEPELARLPILAIGGITPANVGQIAQAGGRGVAVCAAVCAASDPAAVCAALIAALGQSDHLAAHPDLPAQR